MPRIEAKKQEDLARLDAAIAHLLKVRAGAAHQPASWTCDVAVLAQRIKEAMDGMSYALRGPV